MKQKKYYCSLIPNLVDCCDRPVPTRKYGGIIMIDHNKFKTYFISYKRGKEKIGIDICDKCMKKLLKNKQLII